MRTGLVERGVWGAVRPMQILLCGWAVLLLLPSLAFAHGANNELFRTTIVSIEPAGLPVEVAIEDGDEVRIENLGDEMLEVCGYDVECDPWVRISKDGVYEDRNSKSYWFNQDEDKYGDVPEGAGTGAPEWVRVRRAPAFYSYHDHRVHWMAQDTLPPNVDAANPDPQHVFDGKVSFRYGSTDAVITTRLDYVGGQTFLQRNGEYLITSAGIIAMLIVFAIDARRRRARTQHEVADAAPTPIEEDPAAGATAAADLPDTEPVEPAR